MCSKNELLKIIFDYEPNLVFVKFRTRINVNLTTIGNYNFKTIEHLTCRYAELSKSNKTHTLIQRKM